MSGKDKKKAISKKKARKESPNQSASESGEISDDSSVQGNAFHLALIFISAKLSIYIILPCLSVSKKLLVPCTSKTECLMANLSTDLESALFN